MISLLKWMNHVTQALKADYIVEQGTSGIWTYRKWNSGIAECWGNENITFNGFQQWGSLYETTASKRSLTYPNNLFVSTPICNMQISGGYYGLLLEVYGGNGSKDTTPSFAGTRPNAPSLSETTSHNILVHAIGKWK